MGHGTGCASLPWGSGHTSGPRGVRVLGPGGAGGAAFHIAGDGGVPPWGRLPPALSGEAEEARVHRGLLLGGRGWVTGCGHPPCLSGAGGLVGGGAAPLRVLCSDSLRARWSFQKQKCDRRLTLSVPSSTAARGSRAGLPLRMPVAFKETIPAGSEAEGRARGWRPNRSGSPGPAADLACALGVQLGARYLDHDCHTGETAGSGRLSPSRPVRPARQP